VGRLYQPDAARTRHGPSAGGCAFGYVAASSHPDDYFNDYTWLTSAILWHWIGGRAAGLTGTGSHRRTYGLNFSNAGIYPGCLCGCRTGTCPVARKELDAFF